MKVLAFPKASDDFFVFLKKTVLRSKTFVTLTTKRFQKGYITMKKQSFKITGISRVNNIGDPNFSCLNPNVKLH